MNNFQPATSGARKAFKKQLPPIPRKNKALNADAKRKQRAINLAARANANRARIGAIQRKGK